MQNCVFSILTGTCAPAFGDNICVQCSCPRSVWWNGPPAMVDSSIRRRPRSMSGRRRMGRSKGSLNATTKGPGGNLVVIVVPPVSFYMWTLLSHTGSVNNEMIYIGLS